MASYLGLIPREESSGGCQKLGAITKQGNRMLRSLLVEAAQVAVARKLAVRLYWMLRSQVGYPEIVRIESSSGVALVGAS